MSSNEQRTAGYDRLKLIEFLQLVEKLYQEYWSKGVNPGILTIPRLWKELMTAYTACRAITPGSDHGRDQES